MLERPAYDSAYNYSDEKLREQGIKTAVEFQPKGLPRPGAATITVVGSLANKFMLSPCYSKGMPLEAIIDAWHAVNPMINSINAYVIFGAAPFNLVKGIVVSLVVFLIYKKISPIFRIR